MNTRRRYTEALADLAATITTTLDLDIVLSHVAETARELCDADLARIALRESGAEEMTYRYWSGSRLAPAAYAGPRLCPDTEIAAHVMGTRRPFRMPDVLEDPPSHPDHRVPIDPEGSQAVMVAPIRSGEVVSGLIDLGRRERRPFTERDEDVLLRLTDCAAIAIRNAQLHAAERAARSEAEVAARRARLLAEASRVLASSADYDATLRAVTELVVPAVADWCVTLLARRDGSLRRIGPAYAEPRLARLAEEIGRVEPGLSMVEAEAVADAVRFGKPIVLAEVSPADLERAIRDPVYLRLVRELGPKSVIVAPLMARGRPSGNALKQNGRLTRDGLGISRPYGEWRARRDLNPRPLD